MYISYKLFVCTSEICFASLNHLCQYYTENNKCLNLDIPNKVEKLLTVGLSKELKPRLIAKNHLLSGKLTGPPQGLGGKSDILNQVIKPQRVNI